MVVNNYTYSDGGLIANNPVQHVSNEASEMFQDDNTLIISLGTGLSLNTPFDPNVFTITDDLVTIATDTERIAADYERLNGAKAVRELRYFRFNVPTIGNIGLEEGKKLDVIKKATEQYLNVPANARLAKTCASRIAEGMLVLPEPPITSPANPIASEEDLQERFAGLRTSED
jgi:hypothetical protein